MKKILISGASGFVGSSLNEFFSNDGYEVVAIKRDHLNDIDKLSSLLNGSYAVINLAGANIINRWSESYKNLLYSSRINTTKALVTAMEKCEIKPKAFISTSAVGIYKNDKVYDETTSEFSKDFLGNLCKDWENEALKAQKLDVQVSIFRFGIVMGKGGALSKMITPFKLGLGGTIGDGKQAFSFVHINDLLHAYKFVIDTALCGVFNITAPVPTTNLGLTKALGKYLHRPTLLPIPQFVLNFVLSEGAKVLTDGQQVVPNHLEKSGFVFQYKTIEKTIESLV